MYLTNAFAEAGEQNVDGSEFAITEIAGEYGGEELLSAEWPMFLLALLLPISAAWGLRFSGGVNGSERGAFYLNFVMCLSLVGYFIFYEIEFKEFFEIEL